MKKRLTFAVIGAAVLLLVAALFIKQALISSFLVGVSGNLVAVAVGIVIVNHYLENDARKRAVQALFALSTQTINGFHNTWLDLCWARFGKDEYGKLATEYINSGGRPEALRTESKDALYEIYVNSTELHEAIRRLDEALTELSRLAGWSLDPDILAGSLEARSSIGRLHATTCDGSRKAVDAVTEHILDIDIGTGKARFTLKKIAGLPVEE
jgi:hypothetical protein